jgi:Cu/Ag efflux protein CusF
MINYTKLMVASFAVAVFCGNASAADAIANGTVKSVDVNKKTFILSDANSKEFTFKMGDSLLVNREGKEVAANLKAGDQIDVCYDKGILNWTANYILVQEGSAKDNILVHGVVKSYDQEKKEITVNSDDKTVVTFPTGKAMVRTNRAEGKLEDIKIGDKTLLIVNNSDGKRTLQAIIVNSGK